MPGMFHAHFGSGLTLGRVLDWALLAERKESERDDDLSEPAEEGRSDSEAAPRESPDADRQPSRSSDDTSDAPESGTRG